MLGSIASAFLPEFPGVDLVPKSVVVRRGPGSWWIGLDPGSVRASRVLGATGELLASGPIELAWKLGYLGQPGTG